MTESALAELTRLQERLAQIESPGDAKKEIAWADAILKLAKGLGLDLEQQNQIAEHRLRSQRKGGELIPKSGIGKGVKSRTLRDFGLTDDDSWRWQSIADLAIETFEDYISRTIAADDELTTAGLLKLAAKPKPVPGPNAFTLEGGLMRFSPVDLPTPRVVALILRVLFPDAVTALDVTYGSGNFWDGSAHVSVRAHDGDPTRAPDGVMDFCDLQYAEEAFDVVLFDPPHLADAGELSVMRSRFGTYEQEELRDVMCQGAREAWRAARLGIVVKVTDHVHGAPTPSDALLRRQTGWVIDTIGQEPYDVVHQVRASPFVDPKWHEQLSAYNNGSTYLVFRKGDQRHLRRATRA